MFDLNFHIKMVDANYEKLIYLARITEQAERHEETIKYMEEIVKTKKEDY